ncbi:hypothetical protein [Phenylobacterium sp.]|uniref:hypothetical protein n=1 Tax=Phenylobacterium sp. TaxID=1871053 RepID=UPI0030F38F3A
MSLKRSIPVAIAGSLAGVAFVLALLHLIALTSGGEVRIATWRIAAIAAGYDRKADDLVSPRKPSAVDLDTAERLGNLALREFPYDTSSWLRIAYIDQLRHGGLSPAGVAALVRSYDLIAVDPTLAPWRIRLVLENWSKIPNNLKKAAREEAKTLSTHGRGRAKLKTALAAVKNPQSAVMVTLWRQRYVIEASRIEHRSPEKAVSRVGY